MGCRRLWVELCPCYGYDQGYSSCSKHSCNLNPICRLLQWLHLFGGPEGAGSLLATFSLVVRVGLNFEAEILHVSYVKRDI